MPQWRVSNRCIRASYPAKSKARTAPSGSVTTRITPAGVSIRSRLSLSGCTFVTVHCTQIIGVDPSRSQVQNAIGPPRSPSFGPINEIVHIWAFESLDDRDARRARLMADPAWRAFLAEIRDLIEVAENKIMKPAAFSPLGGSAPIQTT